MGEALGQNAAPPPKQQPSSNRRFSEAAVIAVDARLLLPREK